MNDSREEVAARINALSGITDDEDTRRRRCIIRNAGETGQHCADCERVLTPDEPVWRVWKAIARGWGGIGMCGAFAPVCEECFKSVHVFKLPRDDGGIYEVSVRTYYDFYEDRNPRPCEGCGRPVHQKWTLRSFSKRTVCCSNCARRAQAAAAKSRRAKARGTRQCQDCGKIFKPTRTDARFCSVACKQRAYRKRVTNNRCRPRRGRKSRNGAAHE